MTFRTRLLAATAAIAVTALAGPAAQAAGFYIKEQSVTGLGRAFAGESAVAEDASTIFFNPAGLTELEDAEIQAGVHILLPRADLEDEGSTIGAGVPAGGGDGGNPYDPTPVPNLFAAAPLMDGKLWLGVGVTAPFGLGNEYDSTWFGRYDSIKTDLLTLNVAPTVAYQVNDFVSIGAGIDIQYADAELTNAVPTAASLALGAAGDVISRLEGDDLSIGFNIGALFKPSEETRIGVHYRSGISHELEGESTGVLRDGTPAFLAFDATADLDLPDIFAVGVAHDLTDRLTLLGEVNYYRWSNFEEIRVIAEATGATATVVPQNYENTISVAVGAQYDLTDRWTVRGGFQYDETPTTDGFRSTRTPDADRYWLSAGASYEISESFVVDAALTHIFIEEAEVDTTSTIGAGARTLATSEGSVDIVALSLRYRF